MMDDMSENAKSEQYQEKTGRESNPIGVAAVILLLCICFLIDPRVGFGALIGAAAGFFAWSLLKDNGTRKEENADDRFAAQLPASPEYAHSLCSAGYSGAHFNV